MSNKEIRYWQDFIDRGQGELDTQIRLLKSELRDMQENYEIISSEWDTSDSVFTH